MMKESLLALFLADAATTALVGDRIYWLERPQADALPGVTLTVISGVDDYALAAKGGINESRVQADIWATTYTEATAIERALIDAADGPRPATPAGSIQGIFTGRPRDLTDRNGADVLFQISVDLMVKHT